MKMSAMRRRELRDLKLIVALLCAFALAQAHSSHGLDPDKRLEAKSLIDSRQLASAEEMIMGKLMAAPRDPDWITLLAEVRLGQNRTREALKLIDDANQIGGMTATRAMLISLADSQAGFVARSEEPIRTAIRLDPDNATAHYFLSRILYTQGRYDEAIVEGKKTIELAPNFVRAYENIGLSCEGRYQRDEAREWYLKAIDRQSESEVKTEWPALDLAVLLIHENKLSDAKPYLAQALAINPHNTQALVQMGTLLENSGDLKGALENYRAAINTDGAILQPGLASAYYKAARLCKKLGYQDEAKLYFEDFDKVHDKNDKNAGAAAQRDR
jgi:tetratricopeptide (TPR) repeat protein